MNDKKCKTLIGSGIGLSTLGALLAILSPCCTLPAVFALLAGLGLSAALIKLSGSLLIGAGILAFTIGLILFIRSKNNKDKGSCCIKSEKDK